MFHIFYSMPDSGSDRRRKQVQPALAKLKVTYPIVLGDSKISKSYGMGDLLPVTFLIDQAGKIRVVKDGFGNWLQRPKTRPAGEGRPFRILLILWIGAEEGT